jgi:hypothetical protein
MDAAAASRTSMLGYQNHKREFVDELRATALARAAFANLARAAACFFVAIGGSYRVRAASGSRPHRVTGVAACVALRSGLLPGDNREARRVTPQLNRRALQHVDATLARWPAI